MSASRKQDSSFLASELLTSFWTLLLFTNALCLLLGAPNRGHRRTVQPSVIMKTTSPLCRKRPCTLRRRRLFRSLYLCNGFTCHNTAWNHCRSCSMINFMKSKHHKVFENQLLKLIFLTALPSYQPEFISLTSGFQKHKLPIPDRKRF
jgi:hypothetical protein